MKLYDYFCVEPYGNGNMLTLTSADVTTLNFLVAEIQRHAKKPYVGETKDLLGQTIGYTLSSLDDQDQAAFLWTIRYLCENGWEPYAVIPNIYGGESRNHLSNENGVIHYFRKPRGD